MFFDEEMLLDLRLNIMDQYIDKFVITEATYLHSGKKKKLVFDINKYPKFKNKIIYHVVNDLPANIEIINKNDNEGSKADKLINNSIKRENHQREMAQKYLRNLDPDDIVLINDLDEIPNLKNLNFKKIKNQLIIFKQKSFSYKFNLLYEGLDWYGSRACKKKNFISPQWMRNTKHKKYPFWRLDTFFSKRKYSNLYYVEDGGWHFTNIKSPEDIEKKYLNFLHHQDFEYSGLKLDDVKKMVKDKKILYDHSADQRDFKWQGNRKLKKINLSELPDYLRENNSKYSKWLDS
jgi:beta-1,4-mannosyl-glycoprotein beta-1,4-N-acetylglucosaminyltransferase|tara:strand:- start:6058 stop:6930 length:873 start_codon:yes stop_codon:yes gene_type:complete